MGTTVMAFPGVIVTICFGLFVVGGENVIVKEYTPVKAASQIEKVHVVFMNHLDVGYDGIPQTGFINNILLNYFYKHFPQAIRLANQLRDGGYVEDFIYTTHPWLLKMYLDCPPQLMLADVRLKCPNNTELSNMEAAIKRGDITWHAGPMNMQIENMDASLLEYSLNISANLDARFGIKRTYKTLSQRDVPGMSQGAIPSFVKMGIAAVSVGVNPMTAPPSVPDVFTWKYGKQQVIGIWNAGGYPNNPGSDPAHPGGLGLEDCHMVDGFKEALCFAFRTDNSGPPQSVQELLGYYEILRKEFPNAKLMASKLEDFIEALQPFKAKLPVVDKEIGDTWIQGVASDPRKVAEYRAVARVLKNCVQSNACSYADNKVVNASFFLTKPGEHTWGLPTVSDSVNWSNPMFEKARQDSNFINCTMAWLEQRAFTYLAIESLGNHSVVKEMKDELVKLTPDEPNLDDYEQVNDKMAVFSCKDGVDIGFSLEGAVTTLMVKQMDGSNVSWASSSNPLGKFVYISYNETDYKKFNDIYDYHPGISPGYTKPNSSLYAHPESRDWPSSMQELFRKKDRSCDFYSHIELVDPITWKWYGAPREIWVQYVVRKGGVDVTFQWFDKTSTRLPEALMFEFSPPAQSSHHWFISKVGNLVDPMNVILNGSQLQHLSDDGIYYVDPSSGAGLQVTSLDVPLVCPIVNKSLPTPFAQLKPLTEPPTGMAYNFYNNAWDTNYIFWYPYIDADKDFKARFGINFVSKSSTEALGIKRKIGVM